jgi:hypothetical protein
MSFVKDASLAFIVLLLVCAGAYVAVVILVYLATMLPPAIIFFGTLVGMSLAYAWNVRD